MKRAALIIIAALLINGCDAEQAVDIYDNPATYDMHKTISDTMPEPVPISIPEPVAMLPINPLMLPISEESRVALRESMFIGEGAMPAAGGDGLVWYFSAFDSLRADGIPTYIMDITGRDVWYEWRAQFSGRGGARNRRELTLRSFIEDNNITKEDIISAQELDLRRTREEIESLINWARYGIPSSTTDPGWEYFWARLVFSLSDIEALFSGDVNLLWEAFPGYGVVQNNRAYSPEWILNNIRRAVLEEQIPMTEISRIIEMAEVFEVLDAVVAQANALLDEGITGIILNQTEVVLTVGESLTLTVFILPDTDSVAIWVSSNSGVATVDSSGVVTAINRGTATITATTVDGQEAVSEVLVVGGNVTPYNANGVV